MAKSNLDPKILEKQIRDYNTLYRLGEPKVTDAEFDELVELLHNINPDADWFKRAFKMKWKIEKRDFLFLCTV